MRRAALGLALLASACDAASSPPIGGVMSAEECASPEVSLFGVNIDPANPAANPSPAEIHQLGARWVRFVYKADPGFDFYQQRIGEYRAAGIKVLLDVNYESLAAGKPPHDAPAAEWLGYGHEFVQAAAEVARRLGDRVDAYEVWNEPDQLPEEVRDPACTCDVTDRCDDACGCDYQCYDPFVPAEHFGPMADRAGALLAATGRPVVLGGFSSGQPRYVEETIASGGGLPQYAGIAIHPYGADWIEGISLTGALDTFAIGGRQVWVTEIGIGADPAEAAPYLEHVYRTALDGGYAGAAVPAIFWFAWSDANRPGFGLLDDQGRPKATYAAYQNMAPAAHGRCDGGGQVVECPAGQHEVGGECVPDSCGDGSCQGDETPETCGIDCGCAAPGACGSLAPFGCYCDDACGERGDCCSDVAAACGD